MTEQEHDNDPEERPRDALVPLDPRLQPRVRVGGERDDGLAQARVDLVGAVDHDHGGGHDHDEGVDHEAVPADVGL